MTYLLNKNITTVNEYEDIEVFGITVFKGDSMVMKIEDISPKKQFVECILHKLVKNSVSIYHIFDIIEDEMLEYIG